MSVSRRCVWVTRGSTAYAKEYASGRLSDSLMSLNARPSVATAAAPSQLDLQKTAASKVAAGSSSRVQRALSTGAAPPGRLVALFPLGFVLAETVLRSRAGKEGKGLRKLLLAELLAGGGSQEVGRLVVRMPGLVGRRSGLDSYRSLRAWRHVA